MCVVFLLEFSLDATSTKNFSGSSRNSGDGDLEDSGGNSGDAIEGELIGLDEQDVKSSSTRE